MTDMTDEQRATRTSRASRTPRTRARRGAAWAREHFATMQRCPHCHASLDTYAAVAQSSVDVAELAARRVASGESELTSRVLASLYDVTVEFAGQLLRRAEDDGLVRRVRVRLARGGGWEYRYWPTHASAAYLRSTTLARDVGRFST